MPSLSSYFIGTAMRIIGFARIATIAAVGLPSIFAPFTIATVAGAAENAGEQSPVFPPSGRILQCVQRITGLDASFTIARTDSVTVADCLPYLQAPLGKRKGIRVRLMPGKVQWGKPFTVEDAFLRRFTVYLDNEAKQVYAITSQAVAPAASSGVEDTPEEAATPLDWQANSFYFTERVRVVVPSTAPKITFLEAVKFGAMAAPMQAPEINGYYLTSAAPVLNGEPSHGAWVIEMHGLPEIPMSIPFGGHRKWSKVRRGHTQDVIDATVGTLLGGSASNSGTPRPEVETSAGGADD